MARTDAGAALTQAHRQGQLQIRARALQDFIQLWPLWEGDAQSFARLVAATLPLVRVHHGVSSALASAYFQTFRSVEGIAGPAAPVLAPLINADRVTASLYVTGQVMTGKAIAAGFSPQAAMQTALVRTSGAVARHVLQGGRDTSVLSSGADRQAKGWTRITGDACDFCESFVGVVFSGQDAAEFEAHDHCACTAESVY